MGMILNGIALEGLTRPYGGTFLVFSDYMRPAVRLAASSRLPVTYVWTHDSIGLGEDGPTHQPVEHLAALRAIPGLDVVRPADANETAAAWGAILANARPAALRPDPAEPARSSTGGPTRRPPGSAKGGYVLVDGGRAARTSPDVILVATGSEVSLALAARERLEKAGVRTRVVSMPCREWFDRADQGLPREGAARLRSAPGSASRPGWPRAGARSSVTPAARSASSTSAPPPTATPLFAEFGFTPEAVVKAARESIKAATTTGK